MIELGCTLDRSRIPPDVATEVGCQLELHAETAAVAGTVALTTNLCLVLDCSASMFGAKVKAAIQAAKMIVNTIDVRPDLGRRIRELALGRRRQRLSRGNRTRRDQRPDRAPAGHDQGQHGPRRRDSPRHQDRAAPSSRCSVLVILTDGVADSQADAELASAEANEAGVQVFAVGIGEAFRADDLLADVAPSGGTLLGERAADRLEVAFAELLKRSRASLRPGAVAVSRRRASCSARSTRRARSACSSATTSIA